MTDESRFEKFPGRNPEMGMDGASDILQDKASEEPRGLSGSELLEQFIKASRIGDTTGVRTLGHAILLRSDPGAVNRIESTEDYGNGSMQRFMDDGSIYASDDGGATWWIRYSAASDLWYTGPDDLTGMYE